MLAFPKGDVVAAPVRARILAVAAPAAAAVLLALPASAGAPAAAVAPPSRVRIVHAAPGTGPVALWLAGAKVKAPAVPFRKASAWLEVESGSRKVEVFPAKGKKAAPLFSHDAFMLEGGSYTAVVTVPPGADPTTAWLTHEREPAPDDVAEVRFFHAMGGLEWAGAWLEGGPLLGDKIPYAAAGAYGRIAPGKWSLVARSPLGDETITFPAYTLAGGTRYTIVAVGAEGDRQAFLLVD